MSRGPWNKKRKKKQEFNFPSSEQPSVSDEILDAEIDGTAPARKTPLPIVQYIPEIFTPAQVAWILDIYVVALSFIFSILLKSDFKIIYDELKLPEDVREAWAKPLARICSKHAPSEWAKFTDEIELLGGIAMYTATAFHRAKMVSEKEKDTKKEVRNINVDSTQRVHRGVTA